ncbi:putative Rho-GTPase-activating protein [Podospora australis]|uniref:Rho-GTPase-activating protein n=1 Tax=Podospora australis TaxID=1536484 RepID=A0AAN7AQ63_9PEZI|nr:putative Rho-GTPase-activating protein [Podospora australis]
MTSAAPPHPAAAHPSASQQQQQHQQRSTPQYPPSTPVASSSLSSAVSPPSKRDLKSWWKGFKLPSKHQEANGTNTPFTISHTTQPRSPGRRSLFVEDMEGHYKDGAVSVALLRNVILEEEKRAAHRASANMSMIATPTRPRPQEVSKLDTFARLLNWRLGRIAGGSCSQPPYPVGSKLIVADAARPQGIFGVPLRQSITYANVAISLVDENGKSYIYGYVPIVVAKCGVFLKERATEIEGIFRLSGSEKRIKELKTIFDSPDRYGKGLVWDGYTVHDAANVLRRYLNDLPEPVVPLDLYEKFRQPLRGATRHGAGDAEGPQFVENFDMDAAILRYQQLITELPPLNRQLLLYILDLLAVFSAKSDQNRMNSQNLAAIFQPGMLSHPAHAMAPEEYRLNQCVIIFLIENQDHFLIGMQGTAADEKTVQEVQQGTPVLNAPATPRKSGVHRSASNASAGAESVAKNGSIRRNKSTSSRRSMHSNGAPSPGSPAVATTPTSGLSRSNTVPSKKSPALPSGRFGHRGDGHVVPLTPVAIPANNTNVPAVVEEVATPPEEPPAASAAPLSTLTPNRKAPGTLPGQLAGLVVPGARGQEGLLEPTIPTPEVTTPSKERKLPILFQRIATSDNEGRQPNKLRKKRLPGSSNPSAHSSTASLPHSAVASPSVEMVNPLEAIPSGSRLAISEGTSEVESSAVQPSAQPSQPPASAPIPVPVPAPAPGTAVTTDSQALHPHSADTTLKSKKSPPTSLNSSFNESSDLEQTDAQAPGNSEFASPDSGEKERKRRWRLSRKKEETGPSYPPLSSPRLLGSNSNAETSSTSVGSSGYKPRLSITGDSLDRAIANANAEGSSADSGSKDGRDGANKVTNWLTKKYREHKENAEQRRNKSPPGERTVSIGSSFLGSRGKSLDLKRAEEEMSPAPHSFQVHQPPAEQSQVLQQQPSQVPPQQHQQQQQPPVPHQSQVPPVPPVPQQPQVQDLKELEPHAL